MSRIARFIERMENRPIGFGLWLSTALFVIFLRDGIECLISTGSFAIPNGFHLLHVPVFFLSLLVCLSLILHFFTKTGVREVSKIALFGFPIVILPVALDLAIVLFAKSQISYNYIKSNAWTNLWRFFDFSYPIPELPLSIRFEIGLITLLSLLYIFVKRKKAVPALLGAIAVFLASFSYVAIPALLLESFKGLAFVINGLRIQNFPFPKGVIDEVLIGIIELVFMAALALVWLWRDDPAACKAVVGNMRWTRTLHYMLLSLAGSLLQCLVFPLKDIFSLIRIGGCLLAVGFAFQFSVVINDIFDIACDRISNPSRPLIKKALEPAAYLRVGFVYLAFSLLFAYWAGDMCFMAVLMFLALYFLYSTPPLRLKRFFPLSCLIIGIECVLAFSAGECSLERAGFTPQPFPLLHWLILLVFSLSSNIKDLKDTEGDKACGVLTLPVLCGQNTGRRLIAFCVFFSYIFVPFFLHPLFPGLKILILSLSFALANFIYLRRKKAKEHLVFLGYFLYVIFLIFAVKASI